MIKYFVFKKWDIRKPTIHERKFSAHIGSVLAVDWHSDGRTIASGGRDKSIKARIRFCSIRFIWKLF